MSKKIPVFVVSSCLMWFAYQTRDILMEIIWGITAYYTETGPRLLNIGRGQTITFEMPRGFIPKPYAIAVRTEVVNGKEMSFDEVNARREYPKEFLIKTFKTPLFSNQKRLISETTFKEGDWVYSSTSWNPMDERNSASSQIIYSKLMPPGKYTLEIKDLTQRSPKHNSVIVYLEGTLHIKLK